MGQGDGFGAPVNIARGPEWHAMAAKGKLVVLANMNNRTFQFIRGGERWKLSHQTRNYRTISGVSAPRLSKRTMQYDLHRTYLFAAAF